MKISKLIFAQSFESAWHWQCPNHRGEEDLTLWGWLPVFSH